MSTSYEFSTYFLKPLKKSLLILINFLTRFKRQVGERIVQSLMEISSLHRKAGELEEVSLFDEWISDRLIPYLAGFYHNFWTVVFEL